MKGMDLSQGNIRKLVVRTAVPMVVAQLVSMLYNIVDRIFVGRIPEIGAVALGGVGIYLPINIIFMAVSLLFGGGGAPQAAIALGAGDRKKAERYLGCCFLPLLVSGVLFSLCLFFFGEQILPLFGATGTNLPYALPYVRIICLGIPCSMLITGMNIFINTQGKTMVGMISVIIGAVINIVLDAVFILGLNMGVAGAAWATILSQGISALLTLFVLTREKACYRIIWSKVRLDPGMTKKIFFLGLPAAIQMAVTSFSNVFVQAYINRFGSAAMAGWSSYGKIDKFCVLPIQSLSLGVTTFVGQNLGARKIDRVRQSTKVGTLLCFAVAILITIPVLIFARPLVSMFNRTPEVLDYGTLFIRLEMPFYLALCVNQVHAGTLRGIGNTKAPMVIMMSCFIVFRQIYLYTVTQFTDSVIAVALGYPLGWLLCSILLFTYYRHTKLETYLR